jgi:hypothetical protein
LILIYTHTLSPRIAYAMELVLGTVLRLPYELTTDRQAFESSSLPKLAYVKEPGIAKLWIRPHGLLLEKTIAEIRPFADKEYKGFPVFFPSLEDDFLGYDLFAMVFYFATRYEEYLPHETDQHGRFKAEESIAFKHHCLHVPFLNEAIEDFAQKLKQEFPSLVFKKRTFHFLSTIDIDNAFAYAHKGFVRNAAGLLKDLLFLNFKKASERLSANRNDTKDPYNTFEQINALSHDTGTALQYFVLIGDYAPYDKNPAHSNSGFRKLIKALSVKYDVGLHPSYQSSSEQQRIGMEKNRLEDALEKKVTSARCHFLKIRFPETYRQFMKDGITDDYTMIYASQSGFRTGLCVPYQWFDLEKNEATSLTIHTSAVMEGTLRDYNKLPADKAQEICSAMMSEVKKYGGEFISIFHNDSFVPEQKEWIAVYHDMLQQSHKP